MTQNEYDKWYRELNEAQKEATDEFFAWKEKASKGKDCYADIGITRINGKAEVALREGEYISPFRGFQMSLKQNGRILSSCNWRCEDGVEKFPLLFSTKTFKSGKIAAGIFVRDGAMQSPIILGCPDDFEPKVVMKNEKCVKDESHSEFTKEEQEEFLNLLGRITPEQREALKKVLKSFT